METDQVCVKTEEEEKADDVASFPSAETSCIKHIKTERYVLLEQKVRSPGGEGLLGGEASPLLVSGLL